MTIAKHAAEENAPQFFFKEEKSKMKSKFIKKFIEYLANDDCLADAFNSRESINLASTDRTVKDFKNPQEVHDALRDIATTSPKKYKIHDRGRVGNAIRHTECSGEFIKSLELTEMLIYDAKIFLAHDSVISEIMALYAPLFSEPDGEKYARDKEQFENELYLSAGKYLFLVHNLNELQKALDSKKENPLYQAGIALLETAYKDYNDGKISEKNLGKLSTFILGAKEVIQDPTNIKKIATHQKNTEQAIGMNRQWGKLIGKAMSCVLGIALCSAGIALMGASIAAAVGTFGVATPLSLLGLVIASCLVGAGSALAVESGVQANQSRKGDIAVTGEFLLTAARKHREKFMEKKPTEPSETQTHNQVPGPSITPFPGGAK